MTRLTSELRDYFLYGLIKADAKKPNRAQISPAEAVAHFRIPRSREIGGKSYRRRKKVAADKASYLLEQFWLFVPVEESISSPAANHYNNESAMEVWRCGGVGESDVSCRGNEADGLVL